MAMEAWDNYRQRIADCPNCGNTAPHRELAWTSHEEVEPEVGNITMYTFFGQCATCGQPSVFGSYEDDDFEAGTLVWPKSPEGPPPEPIEVSHLAAATELLAARGDTQAASLMVDVLGIRYSFIDRAIADGNDSISVMRAAILVEPPLVDRFAPDVTERIRDALTDASWSDRIAIKVVDVVPVATEGDWRERVERTLGLGPSNQAAILPPRGDLRRADRLTFASEPELRVYEALRARQAALPPRETIMIAPNAGVRVPGTTISPDFIVTYRGRCGVIEVDGPGHRGKWSSDRSRDQLLEDAGVAYVLRVTVEETGDDTALEALIDRLLGRLAP